MTRKLYYCDNVNLTHFRMVELRNSGDLNLGINNDFASRLANEKELGPTKTTANIAFHFWNWTAIGGLAYSIYLSFSDKWWWFVVGVIGVSIIRKANKKGNSENYLDAAMIDEDFYERVRKLKGWIYQMEEEAFNEKLRVEERL